MKSISRKRKHHLKLKKKLQLINLIKKLNEAISDLRLEISEENSSDDISNALKGISK